MKTKVIITILVVLALIAVGAVIMLVVNPVIATQIINDINGVTEPTTIVTEPTTTTPPTEPTTLPMLESIKVDQKVVALEVEKTEQLKPVVLPENTPNKKVYYTSSNEDIASVSVSGLVTALSQGECKINISADANSSITAVYTIKVTDKKIEQINVLNDYINKKGNTFEVKYSGNKKKDVIISNAMIKDINNDGEYELFIAYSLGTNIFVLDVATIKNDKVVSMNAYKNFADILENGYTSLNQTFYTDNDNNIYIKSESIKISGTNHTREVEFFDVNIDKNETYSKSYYKDTYIYEYGNKIPTSGKFYIDDKQVKEEPYLTSLSNYFDGYIEYKIDAKRYVEINDNKYEKILPIVELSKNYTDRITWSSKDKSIATVNNSGVVSAKSLGKTQLVATLDCLNSSISVVSVNVCNVNKNLSVYLKEQKDKKIDGESGAKLSLYGSKMIDIDDDTEQELLLYYKGESQAQIDVVDEIGSKIIRTTALRSTAKSGYNLTFGIFMDNAYEKLVIQEKQTKKLDYKETIEFFFDEYTEKGFKKYTPTYKVNKENGEFKTSYIDNKKYKKIDFDTQINHYGLYTTWDIA